MMRPGRISAGQILLSHVIYFVLFLQLCAITYTGHSVIDKLITVTVESRKTPTAVEHNGKTTIHFTLRTSDVPCRNGGEITNEVGG